MKKMVTMLAVLATMLSAYSATLLTDDFDYATGNLATVGGWTNHNGTTNLIQVTSPGLSFTGFSGSGVGNAVTLTNTGEDVHKAFSPLVTGTGYVGFMLKVNTIPPTGKSDYFFNVAAAPAGEPPALGTNFKGRVFLNDAGKIGISNSSSAAAYCSGVTLNTTDTYFVVVKQELIDGASNDNASIFVFTTTAPLTEPTIDGVNAIAATDAAGSNGDLADFGAVALRQGSAANGVGVVVDGLRVADNWADAVSTTSSIDNNNTALSNVVISAYPNPFNPTTSISFTLPQALNGSLAVYNQAGQKVTELFNGQMKQGLNNFQFNAADLNSGVYFCKLVSGTQSFTNKMVLTK